MSETIEDYKSIFERKQIDRAAKRDAGAKLMRELGVPFELKNGGAHLILQHKNMTIDFWPGTSKWLVRGQSRSYQGIELLLTVLK